MTTASDIAAEIRKAYSADYSQRELVFMASAPLPVADLAEILPGIVPQYNEFRAADVCAWLANNAPDVVVWFGREYSPVVYIAGDAADLKRIQRAAKRQFRADEIQLYQPSPWSESLSGQAFSVPVLRLWWD